MSVPIRKLNENRGIYRLLDYTLIAGFIALGAGVTMPTVYSTVGSLLIDLLRLVT